MRPKSSPNPHQINGSDATLALMNRSGMIVAHVVIDVADLERVLAVGRWAPGWTESAQSFYPRALGGRLLLHRFIMSAPDRTDVDHRDHDTLNCRQRNLLVCTHAQNAQNRKRGYGSSGVRNVYWAKSKNKWRVQFEVAGKRLEGGYFDSLDDAAKAAEDARRIHMPYAVILDSV